MEQSLVVAEARADGTTRYRLLAAVREFAREQPEARGEGEEARRRHAEHYLALAERAAKDRRLAALAAAVKNYEAQFGEITAQEIAHQARADREAARVVRGPRKSKKTSSKRA